MAFTVVECADYIISYFLIISFCIACNTVWAYLYLFRWNTSGQATDLWQFG